MLQKMFTAKMFRNFEGKFNFKIASGLHFSVLQEAEAQRPKWLDPRKCIIRLKCTNVLAKREWVNTFEIETDEREREMRM